MARLTDRIAHNAWLLRTSRDLETFMALKGRRQSGGHGTLRLRGLDSGIQYRPDSTDVAVVWELFKNGEYHFSGGWPFRTVVDCGANSGMFLAWVMRESRGQLDRYIGVEPDPDAFAMLSRQAKALRIEDRASLVNAAVWHADGHVAFDDSGPSWGHSVREDGKRQVRACSMSTILDEAGLEHADLIKIDIEGGEATVLQGMGTWASRADAIVVELHGGLGFKWFAEQVTPHGFTPFAAGKLFRDHCGAVRTASKVWRPA